MNSTSASLSPPRGPPLPRRRLAAAAGHRLAAARGTDRASRSARAEAAAFPGQGQARHLHLLERRRVAHGHVRPQAEALRRRRQDDGRRRRPVESADAVLLKPGWEFKPGGKCGTLVSDLFPHLRECMDDICLIRSMKSDDNEHYQATLGFTPARSSSRGRASARGSATAWAR